MGHRLPVLAIAALFALPAVASAQVADPECEPPRSTTEALLEELRAIPLPAGCAPVDVKPLLRRVKDAPIGMLTKLRFLARGKSLLDDAKEYDRDGRRPDKLAKLRRDYDELLGDFASKVRDDAELTRDLGCARDAAFTLLLQGAALENEKDRREAAGHASNG